MRSPGRFSMDWAGKLKRRRRRRESRALIRRLLREGGDIKLDAGGGGRKGDNGWLTIDLTRRCDIYWDLRDGLPFPDGRVAAIYTSHFLEHLTYSEGQRFLGECLRVLAPGGELSVCVPNARMYIEAYLQPDSVHIDPDRLYAPAYNHTTRIDIVNYMAYMDGHHKYMFDEENLLHVLKAGGFRETGLREFDPALDSRDRDFESIYACAIK